MLPYISFLLFYFSPVDGTQKEYISKVLVCLLHMLPNPAILASLVTKSEAKLCRGVRSYLQFWAGGKVYNFLHLNICFSGKTNF